jgi:hypothetical protein
MASAQLSFDVRGGEEMLKTEGEKTMAMVCLVKFSPYIYAELFTIIQENAAYPSFAVWMRSRVEATTSCE